MAVDLTTKGLKPLTADQPAAANQRVPDPKPPRTVDHPSASPAAPADKPAEGSHTADKQTQPSKEKKAALKRAETLSILYKYAKDRSFQIKKAAIKDKIREVGLDNVIGAIQQGFTR